MNLGWLQDFLTVAELRNFTRAADARNASQAAFSRRIMALEAWLGVTLIDRSVFPTRLTAEGERFRDRAAEIVGQVTDARMDLSEGAPFRDRVRIALPHALATGRLSAWSRQWSGECGTRPSLIAGNVHDMVTALASGGVDILICFQSPQHPLHLSADQYERTVIGREPFRPYAAPGLLETRGLTWPGSARRPVPLLSYAQGAYLGRMVDQLLEAAPVRLHGVKVAESDMADVLRALALGGQGVAWLPDCSAAQAPPGALEAIEGPAWSLTMSLVAYRDRSLRRVAVDRLWEHLRETSTAS